jgi:poly-beta-hydroxyalkanoate depolymerase
MVTRLLVAAAVAVVGPLAAVQTAHADTNDTKFIALLNSEGITDHIAPSHAIEAAHSVCTKLEGGESPNAVANDVLNSSSMPAYHSGYFVGAAIKVYCPQFTPEESAADNPPKS